MTLLSNPQLESAFEYVFHTQKNIFLTGKAGTGKTTFLHQIKQKCPKRMAVVAPTGVAAINAGGMTIHSFFQLPFGPFLPNTAREAAQQRRFSGDKIRLIKSLDLLVIDEVSMVRADMLDGIDSVLRRYRDWSKPFGGVQLLLIGDLHQLPPVVKDEEWRLLREHYRSSYFFESIALQQTQPVRIELKHIFRQSDEHFIQLLNKVRENRLDDSVLQSLNSRYVPHFEPSPDEPYITLTALNAKAQALNAKRLSAIDAPVRSSKAEIKGEFPPHAYPADELFEFKVGAQVMFLKNDPNREKRYFNGKIGQITRLGRDSIFVRCPGEMEDIEVFPAVWENIKYSLNEKSKEVSEAVIGSFIQFPLRLAWAITIHKSQGLTFERVIIDAQDAFAHGQVYVALSRCKTLEGIVLQTKIALSSVKTDFLIRNYSDDAAKNPPDDAHLTRSKAEYQQSLLLDLFQFAPLKRHFERLRRLFLEHQSSLHPEAGKKTAELAQKTTQSAIGTAERFVPQLHQYFAAGQLPEEHPELLERLKKAGAYFTELFEKELLPAAMGIHVMTDNKSVEKSVMEELEALQKEFFVKKNGFSHLRDGFSANRYLQVKTDAELDFKAAKQKPAPAALPTDLVHPALFEQLKIWRAETAEALGAERYQVMATRTLIDISNALPLNQPALLQIKGIGAVKSQQFGEELLAIVRGYCEAHRERTGEAIGNESTPTMPALLKGPKGETKLLSLEAFRAGKTLDEIAQERELARSTIEGHLAHYVGLGELNVLELMTQEQLQEIRDFLAGQPEFIISEAKLHFGEKYSYGQIRMAHAHYWGRDDRQVM